MLLLFCVVILPAGVIEMIISSLPCFFPKGNKQQRESEHNTMLVGLVIVIANLQILDAAGKKS